MMHRRLTWTLLLAMFAVEAHSATAALIELTPTGPAFVSADSVKLADLLGAQPQVMGILVGDKIFDGFGYGRIGADMPLPEDVNVFGFQDVQGNWGLRFQGIFRDRPGGGDSDAQLAFNVTVAPFEAQRGWLITDAHLSILGYGLGANSELFVDESIQGVAPAPAGFIAGMSVGRSTLGSGFEQPTDETVFDRGYTKIRVTKDIYASAGNDANQSARTTIIDQSFSQTQIPEPTALGLAGMATLACGALRRRK